MPLVPHQNELPIEIKAVEIDYNLIEEHIAALLNK